MKKENMKKQYRSSGATVQSALSFSGTHSKQSPSGLRLICNARFLAIAQRFLTNLHHTGLTAPLELFPTLRPRSSQTNLPCLTLDPRVKPEGDSGGERVKPEGGSNKIVFENDNMGRLGEGNMKRTFSAAVLTLCSVFLFSSITNAACSPVDCAALGYTKTEAACNGSSTIRCPFDVTKVNCIQKDSTCKGGDIYYSDGTCDANVIPGKTPIGVVAYVTDGGKHGAVIALEEKMLMWSNRLKDLSCLPDLNSSEASADMNGKSNTACIMSQTNDSYPAAEYCNGYKPVSSGKGSSDWYLPGTGELMMMKSYYGDINLSLQRLSKTQLMPLFYWSSSECGAYVGELVWSVNPFDGSLNHGSGKNNVFHVRCMLEF